MNSKLLSICIPTYERELDLRKCIDSIISMKDSITKHIEICVSDNCSSYSFENLVSSYLMYQNIVFSRNDENIGFDQNLLKAVQVASGKYIMFLGNDEIVLEDGISELINIIIKFNPDGIFSNYKITYLKEGNSYLAYKERDLKLNINLYWILENLKVKSGFISSITLKREFVNLKKSIERQYIKTGFIHVAIFLITLRESNNIVYLPNATTNAFDNNPASYDVKKLFIYDLGFVLNTCYLHKNIAIFKYKISTLKHVFFSGHKISIADLKYFKFLNKHSLIYVILSNKLLYKPYLYSRKVISALNKNFIGNDRHEKKY